MRETLGLWLQLVSLWYTRAAQFFLVQVLLTYSWASIVAHGPIGPVDYIRFLYHTIVWEPGQTPETTPDAPGR